MPEEIKDKAPEEELNEEERTESASAEQEEKKPEPEKKSVKLKWIFIILAAILLVSGLGIKYGSDKFSFLMKKKFETTAVKIEEDNLKEEVLSPFFIPPGPADNTIRIDLSIVWDGLASIRFRKKELNLRSMMYEKFYNMAEQNQDLNEKIPYLENEVSSMLRSSLGVQNLAIKIKEIRYF